MAGREKNCRWYFADQPNGQEVGPNNPMEQNFKHYTYISLVRESIQNSLDAVLDERRPVLVKFSFMSIKGEDFPNFFEIQKHIKGCLDYFPNNTNAKALYEPMLEQFDGNRYHECIGYIRVSDYNTKGMDYKENKTDSPFYAFVRSSGVSAKENNSPGGSYGFGKAAYFLISPISTIIVSTCTENYNKYFEGIASFCTHLYRKEKKVAVGYYDDNDGLPITNEMDIPSVFRRTEPGTDINIMGFDLRNEEEAITEITQAVLRNFWMAILSGKLIVAVGDDIQIDKNSIVGFMDTYFPDEDDTAKKTNFYNPRPYFDAVRLCGTEKRYYLYEDNLPLLGNVKLFINKKKSAPDKIAFIRSLQMLVYTKKNKSNNGMYGVFYCDDPKGNEILRNMENPAHDEWKTVNWKVNRRTHSYGKNALKELEEFINDGLKKMFSLKEKTILDIKGLEEFLYIPTEYDEDENLESESFIGMPTGELKDDGNSFTTDIIKGNDNPTIKSPGKSTSSGQILINHHTSGVDDAKGRMLSGHSDKPRKTKVSGIQKPGDVKDRRKEDSSGKKGIFATPVSVPYRSFSQTENGIVYHYIVLHSEESFENVRLHFYAVGEDSEDELKVAETNTGNISGNIVRDIHLVEGRTKIRVRFTDNMKHSVKLLAEETYEI